MKTVYLLLLKLLVVSLWEGGKANDVVARDGDNVTFSFNIKSEDNAFRRANSSEILIKLKDDFPSLFDNSYKERVQFENKTIQDGLFNLTLLNVSSSDAGFYVCRGRNKDTTCSLLVILKEPERPEVKCDPEPVEDEQVKLTCSSTSNSLPKSHSLEMRYEWMENGQIHPSDAADILINVSRNDRGNTYTCRAYDETNTPRLYSEWSEPFVLHPLYGPDSIKIYPEQVLEGTNITCRADCNPNCNITWGGQAGQLTSGLGQVTFRMNRGQPESSCKAWNEHGNTNRSVNVSLVFPPQISLQNLGDANKIVHEGEPLNFNWFVSSNPEPTFIIISSDGRSVRMMSEGTDDSNYMISYTIDKATCDDHGILNGTAQNQFGSDSSSVAVTVYCSPRLDSKPERVPGSKKNSRRFMIQSYPEPTLEAIFSVSPGGNSKAISLPHKLIQNDQDTQDGLTIQRNLHKFIVDFPCEASDVKYLLTFNNSEEKKNISFSLEENSCHVGAGALVYISVAIVITTVVLVVLISGVLLYRRRKRAGRRRYSPHGTGNITRNSRFRQEYATVPKKSERPRKEKVEKTKQKTFACPKHIYENLPFVGPRNPDYLNPLWEINCGEKNADLEKRKTDQDIDFTMTPGPQLPGPQLPDKIWEIEKL